MRENPYYPGVRKDLSSKKDIIMLAQDTQQSFVTSLHLAFEKQSIPRVAYWIEDDTSFPTPFSPYAMLFFKLTKGIAMAISGKSNLGLCPLASL